MNPYYNWLTLTVAALAMVGTLPGRTQGLGLVTEPLLRDFNIDRVHFAQINLFATLVGSLFCIGIGRAVDRAGSRVVLATVAAALGVVVLMMSAASALWAIVVLITLTRGFGQSALSVVSLAAVGKWFSRRLPVAMGIYAVIMSVGFMLAFPAVGAMTLAYGWRVAWAAMGVALVCGLAPLAWLLARSTPEECGLQVDGDAPGTKTSEHTVGATLHVALRTSAFWVFALSSAIYGLVASGIALFNESILAERGFDPSTYHRSLVVTALTALAGNFAAGAYADRGSLRHVLVAAMTLLGAGLAALPHVSTEAQVMGYAAVMGAAGGFVMVVFFAFWGRAYGRRHLGRIQGAAQVLTVLASAVGPLLLAMCVRTTGSYAAAFYALAAMVAALAVAALVVRIPTPLSIGADPLKP
jgi:MFS family permease